jgi:hypothetical protein
MLIKITANSNALVIGTETIIAAAQESIIGLTGENHVEVDPSTGKLTKVYMSRPGASHNVVAIGTTATTVYRIQVGNLTNDGKFHTVLDSL